MSDATRASEPTGRELASPDSTSSEQPNSGKKRWAHRIWNVGRVLATIATIMLLYSYWIPWVVVKGYTVVGDQVYDYTLTLGPGDVDSVFGQAVWSSATMLLVIACILMWQHKLPILTYVGAVFYLQFAVLIDRMGPEMPTYVRQDAHYVRLVPGSVPSDLVANPIEWLPGFYLNLSSLVLTLVAILLLIISLIMRDDEIRAAIRQRTVPRDSYSQVGGRALLAGIFLWALGALVLPWRAGGCAQIPIVAHSCAPAGFGDMLQRGLSGDPALLNPRIGMYALPALLVYLALLSLAGLWRRVPLRLLATWTSLWLAGSSVALAFALRGLLMTRPIAFGPGLFVAFAGLFLAACGLAWLYAQAPASPEVPDQLMLG